VRTAAGKGCPRCGKGWTVSAIRGFIASLVEHLESFTPAELYLLFQQNGLLDATGKGRGFVKALTTGRFPVEELEKFVSGEPSLVDEFVADSTQTVESLQDYPSDQESPALDGGTSDTIVDEGTVEDESDLPVVEAKEVLGSLTSAVVTTVDAEAVEFLTASACEKLWRHAFRDEDAAVKQAETFVGEGYADRVRTEFLAEYGRACSLQIPSGYAFRIDGKPTLPNLMQRLAASRVADDRRVGNWSGTGAGKTLSAVLASRVVGARLTVICCPNSVVEGWKDAILAAFPDSGVVTKTFRPQWEASGRRPRHRYLVLNYESFQQPDSPRNVRAFADEHRVDFIVVDEIHFTKQREVEKISQRKRHVAALIALAEEKNANLHVLGMSATPVINNLQEGKSLVELVTGVAHDDLETRATVPNCMKLHQQLVRLGLRWVPAYDMACEQETYEVDCSAFLDDVRALGDSGTPLALEQVLTRARLPVIRAQVERKTLIYTHYLQGIDRLLRDTLEADGWKVGFFTGEDKTGLDAFIDGDLDVLIGSSAISTGVDGLQQVCSKLIINVLPWTHAEFEQLKGRIFRQGQRRRRVQIIIPVTYAEVAGQRWSWCESKLQRLKFKKSIADAAVDGVVPEGHLRSPAQAYQDVMGWLRRLDANEVVVVTRPKIAVPLPDTDRADVSRRRRQYGDFSALNRRWNRTHSGETHKRLKENPEEWAQYHTLYRQARKDWAVVPYEEMIRWCQRRSGYVIGDFGCGEAKLAEVLSDRHTVHSFDHVAINPEVVACDMAHVSLDDESLDAAVFSLSLMGANFTDYLLEAYRTLKLDGHLHIIEATARFSNRDHFAAGLRSLGYDVVSVADRWKFTHIHAVKTERAPDEHLVLHL